MAHPINAEQLKKRSLEFIKPSCTLNTAQRIILEQIQSLANELNSSVNEDVSSVPKIQVNDIVQTSFTRIIDARNENDQARVVSLASPEFTVGLHHRTPLNELLCSSLANTLHIAISLYNEKRSSQAYSSSSYILFSNTESKSQSISSILLPNWLSDIGTSHD